MSDESVESIFTLLAKTLVYFESRVEEIVKLRSEGEIKVVIKRCRREAHPEPGDGHNFEMPAWDRVADLLERELHLRHRIQDLEDEKVKRP